jgi:exopolyphosphatase/guanosine-5'-triphosphate,3'-diphosphate pyrophosphatase
MIFASIDIGSNAVRLLFANAFDKDGVTYVEKATLVRIPVRLGKDVFKKGRLSEKRIRMLIKTLKAFALLIDVYKPVGYLACATSAIREAANGMDVIRRIRQEVGLKVKVIDGMEEATIIGSLSWFEPRDYLDGLILFIDVGGGSTELSLHSGKNLLATGSFKVGTMRGTAKKDRENDWAAMLKWLRRFENDFGRIKTIGTGGNINKINKIYSRPDNHILTLETLQYAWHDLRHYTIKERMEVMGMRRDRADVIVPAAQIFISILKTIRCDRLLVPKVGLADGLVLRLYEKHRSEG